LRIDPCIPSQWTGYTLTYRVGRTSYVIQIHNPDGVNRGVRQVSLDGATILNGVIPLTNDDQCHQVQVVLGQGTAR